MGTAEIQGQLWGSRARDWTDFGENTSNDLFNSILRKTKASNGEKLLDIGCGAGKFCEMASRQGFRVSGIDASESLIAIARERLPEAEFQIGEMEELPYPDNTFDVVTGFNSFQFAGDIVNALRETKRVAKRGAQVVMVVWGKPEDCEATAVFTALAPFMPPPPVKPPARPPLYTEGTIEALAEEAGLSPGTAEEIDCHWDFKDEQAALRAMLSAGGIALAIQKAGEKPVREAVAKAIVQFKKPNGSYQLRNRFCCLVSRA